MGILIDLFGQKGMIWFEGTTIDGRFFDGKTEVGIFGMDKEDIEGKLKPRLSAYFDVEISDVKVIKFKKY